MLDQKIFTILLISTILILAIYQLSYVDRDDSEIEHYSDLSMEDNIDLALVMEKLGEKGAKLYTIPNCPYCVKQKELLSEHLDKIEVINCVDGDTVVEKCKAFDGFPAWEIDGKAMTGMQPIEKLHAIAHGNERQNVDMNQMI